MNPRVYCFACTCVYSLINFRISIDKLYLSNRVYQYIGRAQENLLLSWSPVFARMVRAAIDRGYEESLDALLEGILVKVLQPCSDLMGHGRLVAGVLNHYTHNSSAEPVLKGEAEVLIVSELKKGKDGANGRTD